MHACGAIDIKERLLSKDLPAFETELLELETAARMGLKFSFSLLLLAEVIMLAFHKSKERLISRRDTGNPHQAAGPYFQTSL